MKRYKVTQRIISIEEGIYEANSKAEALDLFMGDSKEQRILFMNKPKIIKVESIEPLTQSTDGQV